MKKNKPDPVETEERPMLILLNGFVARNFFFGERDPKINTYPWYNFRVLSVSWLPFFKPAHGWKWHSQHNIKSFVPNLFPKILVSGYSSINPYIDNCMISGSWGGSLKLFHFCSTFHWSDLLPALIVCLSKPWTMNYLYHFCTCWFGLIFLNQQ